MGNVSCGDRCVNLITDYHIVRLLLFATMTMYDLAREMIMRGITTDEITTGESSTVCIYFDVGWCRGKKKCRFSHPTEDHSSESCLSKDTCMKTHKALCRNGENCRFKSYGKCTFKHSQPEDPSTATEEDRAKLDTIPVCFDFDVGYCSFKVGCRFKHPTQECDNPRGHFVYPRCEKTHKNPCNKGENCVFFLRKNCAFSHRK